MSSPSSSPPSPLSSPSSMSPSPSNTCRTSSREALGYLGVDVGGLLLDDGAVRGRPFDRAEAGEKEENVEPGVATRPGPPPVPRDGVRVRLEGAVPGRDAGGRPPPRPRSRDAEVGRTR